MVNQRHRELTKAQRLDRICAAIEGDLRQVYSTEFDQAHEACAALVRLSEPGLPKDYVDLDAAIVADMAGSNEVKRVLPHVISRHLPGATLHDQVDEPAVIDSTWLYGRYEIVVEWDYTRHFGDPDGLTVTAQQAVAQ